MTDTQTTQNEKMVRRSCHKQNQDRSARQQRLISGPKKQDALMCSVCEGSAHGYNFNAITCESCKAFFRRNALKSHGKLKCRFENGRCVVNMATRKRCKACRLAKCLAKGMRADWILTEAERLNKRQKIEENRRLRQMLYPDSSDTDQTQTIRIKEEPNDRSDVIEDKEEKCYELLEKVPAKRLVNKQSSIIDWNKIEEIQQAYRDSVRLASLPGDVPTYPHTARINATSDMMNFPANIQATRLITFFKLLSEFSSLREHDKLILIKYNTFPLTFIRAALNYNPLTDTYHEPNTDEPVFEGRDLIQCFSLYHYERSTRCVRNLLSASMSDPLLLKTLLIIMLFSKGAAICTYIDEVEPIAEDILSIYQAQNYFVELLWHYCHGKFGSRRTHEMFLKFTLSSMDAHLQAFDIRHSCVKVDRVADQLAPLMKSVMLIV